MRQKLIFFLLAAFVLFGATMVVAQDGATLPAKNLGLYSILVGGVGLAIKGLVELGTRYPKIPNKVVAASGLFITALAVWGIAGYFGMDFDAVFGAVSSGGWLGSLANTAAKPVTGGGN